MYCPDIVTICLPPEMPGIQALDRLNQGRKGIVLVVDSERRLLGTVVDGDVRRALLGGIDLQAPLGEILAHKRRLGHPDAVTAGLETSDEKLLELMQTHDVRQIPLLDSQGRVADLVTQKDIMPDCEPGLSAMIMAGGYGKRLYPLTKDCPKPLLPVGDRPLLRLTIDQLRQVGIRRVSISTHYLAEMIHDSLGDGLDLDMEISYLTEDKPLGTAGALGLLDQPTEPLLIINGDIITQVDFRSMLEFHRQHEALLTVAVRKFEVSVPFGVMETEGERVVGLAEKPVYSFFINAGIYLLEPRAVQFVNGGERLDMTDLIARLLAEGETVVSFPILEYWLDVGNPSDYAKAQEDARQGRLSDPGRPKEDEA